MDIHLARTVAFVVLSVLAFVCAAPPADASDESGSTCDSRWQSCTATCGALYGREDAKAQEPCERLCDEIHDACSDNLRR